jgi:hypothetical protein
LGWSGQFAGGVGLHGRAPSPVHNKERSPTLYCLVIQFESTTTRAFHACWELINSASEPQKRTKKGQLAINDDHRLLMDFVSSPRAHLMHALGYASAPFLEPDRSTNQKENIRVSSCVIDPPRPPPVAVVWQHKLEIVNATVQ